MCIYAALIINSDIITTGYRLSLGVAESEASRLTDTIPIPVPSVSAYQLLISDHILSF